MKVISEIMFLMEEELSIGQIVQNMKENGKMEKETAEEAIS